MVFYGFATNRSIASQKLREYVASVGIIQEDMQLYADFIVRSFIDTTGVAAFTIAPHSLCQHMGFNSSLFNDRGGVQRMHIANNFVG